MRALLAMAMLLPCAVPASAAESSEPSRRVFHLSSGVFVRFVKGWTASMPAPQRVGSELITRAFTDLEACTYFGYELAARRVEGGIELSLFPLRERMEAEIRAGLSCERPRPLVEVPPRFPPPKIVPAGQPIELTLLEDPATGTRVTDEVELLLHQPRTDEPPRLRIEHLWLRVTGPSILRVGQEKLDGGGCAGEQLSLHTPAGAIFIVSIVQRRGFEEAGTISGNWINFAWEGTRYEWWGREPVLGARVFCPLWVMKVPPPPPSAKVQGLWGSVPPPGRFACGGLPPTGQYIQSSSPAPDAVR